MKYNLGTFRLYNEKRRKNKKTKNQKPKNKLDPVSRVTGIPGWFYDWATTGIPVKTNLC